MIRPVGPIDCGWMWRQKKSWRVTRRSLCLLQKTPMVISEKETVQPRDAFEDTAFKPGFKTVNFITKM